MVVTRALKRAVVVTNVLSGEKLFSDAALIALSSLAFLSFTPTNAARAETASQGARFGLGVILGEPTGISSQVKLTGRTALNSAFAYSFNEWVMFSTDYVMKFPNFYDNLFKAETGLIGTIGIGGLAAFDQDDHADGDFVLAARVPFGGEYPLKDVPITFFFELTPGLQLIDKTDLILQGGIGGRYYF